MHLRVSDVQDDFGNNISPFQHRPSSMQPPLYPKRTALLSSSALDLERMPKRKRS